MQKVGHSLQIGTETTFYKTTVIQLNTTMEDNTITSTINTVDAHIINRPDVPC